MSFNDYSLVEKLRNRRDEERFDNEKERIGIIEAHQVYNSQLSKEIRHNARVITALSSLNLVFAYPFMRLCTIHQARPDMKIELHKRKIKMSSIFPMMSVIKTQGIGHMYRGFFPTFLMAIPLIHSSQIISGLFSRAHTEKIEDIGSLDSWYRGLLAIGMTTIMQIFVNPLNIARVKLAADVKNKRFNWGFKYFTTLDVLARVVRYNGIMALWTGCTPLIVRNILMYHFCFVGTSLYRHSNALGKNNDSLYTAYFGEQNIAAWAVFFSHSIDTVRTRMQYRLPTHADDIPQNKYPKMWNILSPRGTTALFRGCFSAFLGASVAGIYQTILGRTITNAIHPGEKYDKMLFIARETTNRRLHDENLGRVERFPRNPTEPYPLTL